MKAPRMGLLHGELEIEWSPCVKMGFSVEHSFLLQIAKEGGGEWGGDWGSSHVSIANAPREGGERSARFQGLPPVSH